MFFLVVTMLTLLLAMTNASAPATWTGDEETISHCTSQGTLSRQPREVFSLHDQRGGYLSYLFFVFAVEHYPDGGETTVTITVDGDVHSAVEFRLYEAIGIWPRDERKWGTSLFGKGGENGAVYLNIPVPFDSSVVVTAHIPELHPGGEMYNNQTNEAVWTCGRALVGRGIPVVHNGLTLPPHARLRLHRNRQVELQPLQLLELMSSPASTATMVIAYTMLIDADGLNSFEGCLRQHSKNTDGRVQSNDFSLIAGMQCYTRGHTHTHTHAHTRTQHSLW